MFSWYKWRKYKLKPSYIENGKNDLGLTWLRDKTHLHDLTYSHASPSDFLAQLVMQL